MKLIKKNVIAGIALSTTMVLSACGGSSGDTSSSSELEFSSDFAFPAVTDTGDGAGIEVPEGPAPEFSDRRTVSKGAGNVIKFGDPVVLKYNMYSWSTGELVDSTDTLDEPLTILAGVTNGVPDYLTKSLLGRQVGETIQVVFERNMADLPEYLDSEDAYVLVVSLL